MRKHWMDNLRWVTVILVLLYHVVYFYNNKGVFGGIGGFGDGPQYQDVLMYILYPWFMPLLFILAGISARYALESHTAKEWFRARTRKLLVPGTIGLFVFQWMTGYFNTLVAGQKEALAAVPGPGKYIMCAISGTGPLWFVQVLWLLSLGLLLLRAIDRKDRLWQWGERFWGWCGKAGIACIIVLGILFWAGSQTLIQEPRPESADGLINLYKPIFYLITFLLGYYVFSHERVQESLKQAWLPLLCAAAVSGAVLIATTFGQDNTSPQYLGSPLNCLYGWVACLAMIAWFQARFDRTGDFATYMTRSSFGLYIVHYLIVAALGYMMKTYTSLPPVAMYAILTVAVLAGSVLLYEVLSRIPFIRWCVFGIKAPSRRERTAI